MKASSGTNRLAWNDAERFWEKNHWLMILAISTCLIFITNEALHPHTRWSLGKTCE